MSSTAPSPGPEIVWGPTAADYARHRLGPPDEAFRRLAALGVGVAGQRVVDLGTGTGVMARAFAARGCTVSAVDVDAGMLAAARELADAAGLTAIELRQAPAEATGLATGAFDVVIAAQCWHWFDRAAAAAEAWRLLAPGGAIALTSLDWLRLTGNLIDQTMTLAARHRAAPMPPQTTLGEHGFYGQFAHDLGEAGFGALEAFVFDLDVPYTAEGWRGRIRASVPVLMMTPDEAAAFDRAHAELLAGQPSPLLVPHRMSAIVARKPAP